jgi:eukaryotic-like serine/threonine-protein kinase
MSFQIGDVVGDYKIIAVLGAGGMGKVYKVKNQISDRIDALKVLLPSLADNQKQADRFIREIKVLASLNHPNIAALRTAFRVGDELLMLMEYIEGRSLEKEAEAGAVPIRDATDYIRQVLAALDYAHAHGVIHRDIKPANMMLTPERVIKLMDFGIAKSATEEKLTQTGAILGSLAYMSPEQVQGSGLDSRSDLYSVGISLYEFITGSRPFQGTNYQMMAAQLQQIPQPPMERLPGVPQAINDVIMKAIEKDPAKRFQSAAEFDAALREDAPAPPGMTSFQASGTMTLSTPSDLLVTRKQTVVQPVPPGDQAPAAPSPDPSVAQGPAFSAQPPVPVVMPAPRSKFLLPAMIGVGVVAVLAVLFFVFYHPKKADTTTQVPSPPALPAVIKSAAGDMVLVAGGDALLGPNPKSTYVGSFYIDQTEVTNGAYENYTNEQHLAQPPGLGGSLSYFPVVNVTYDDASSFCSWAGKRLPTAVEWEKAARGSDGLLFPWGNTFDPSFANVPADGAAIAKAKVASATSYPGGKSPYGALNMLGNVWEWINDAAHAPSGEEFQYYQHRVFPDLTPPLSHTEPYYHARGGSFQTFNPQPEVFISDPGTPLPARARKPDVGFRCAMDPKN